MAKYRQLFTSFWKDTFITELTPEDKLINIKSNRTLEDDQWVSGVSASSEIVTSGLKIFDKIFTLKGIREECKRLKIQGRL